MPSGTDGVDNRDLCDDGLSQRLSREEILAMRASGISGQEVGVWSFILFLSVLAALDGLETADIFIN